jgi:cobalamin biosynthesis protein CobD/CbiB
MDEEAIIANTVEYTARALVPSVVAPLFYSVIIGPLGAVLYRYIDEISVDDIRVMTILNYIPARLAFASFWTATSTVTKNRAYMMDIVKRDMPNSQNHTADLIVAGFAGTTWMKLGGDKYLYFGRGDEGKPLLLRYPAFGDMREPPHISDILRATKLFNLTVIIFIVLALCIREYEFIWYFLKKFVI